jgi:hypothetical protein
MSLLPVSARILEDRSRCYAKYLLRALSSSLLSLLLVTTLIGGGCISCEQYFMFGSSHGCCNPDGHCKTKAPAKNSSGRDCKQIAFDHQKGIDLHFDLPSVAVERIALPLRTVELLRWHDALPLDPSPPDLQVLHSIFLI